MTLRMQGVLEILPEVEESAPVVPDSSAPALLRLVRVGTGLVSSKSPSKLSPYWVKRRFVLTDDSMRYCTASTATPQLYQRREHGASFGQIRADRRLQNAKILVSDITGVVPRAENKFDVQIRGGKKWRLRVPSNNHHARRMWIDHILGVAARSSRGLLTPAAGNIYREDSLRSSDSESCEQNRATSDARCRDDSAGAADATCTLNDGNDMGFCCGDKASPSSLVTVLQQMGFVRRDCIQASRYGNVDDALEWLLARPFITQAAGGELDEENTSSGAEVQLGSEAYTAPSERQCRLRPFFNHSKFRFAITF